MNYTSRRKKTVDLNYMLEKVDERRRDEIAPVTQENLHLYAILDFLSEKDSTLDQMSTKDEI